jgi:hypothetical protein
MSNGTLTWALISAGLLQCLFWQAAQAEETCPSASANHYKTSDFSLLFDSVITPVPGSTKFKFERCVANKNPQTQVYVDWDTIDLSGFVGDSPMSISITSETDKYDALPSNIYVGAARNIVKQVYYRSKEETPFYQAKVVVDKFTNIITEIRMAVPRDAADPEKTLVDIKLQFIADVTPLAEGNYRYNFTWYDLSESGGEPFNFIWKSETLMAMTEGANLMALRKDSRSAQFAFPPTYGLTVIEILDAQNRPVASAPVAIFHPSNFRS